MNRMEQPREGEQPPPQQPWGRLLRLGAEEGEPHVLLRKREWTFGRKRGAGRGRAPGRGRELGTEGPGGVGERGPGSGVGTGSGGGSREALGGAPCGPAFPVSAAMYLLTGVRPPLPSAPPIA